MAPVECLDTVKIQALTDAGLDVHAVIVGRRTPLGELARSTTALARAEPYAFYHRHNWARLRRRLRQLIRHERLDAFYLDHLDSFLYAGLAERVPCVLDMHNVYSTILERTSESRTWLMGRAARIEARRLRAIERRAVRTADLTLSVSENDAAVFRKCEARRVELVPNGVDVRAYSALPLGRASTPIPKLVYVGALSWQPNEAAVRVLATEILETVRARYPTAEVHLVGRDPSPEVAALAKRRGVHIHANVPDVRPYLLEATALVVPLEVGGGTRLKILEAFAAGLPVVSTPVGCEGLQVKNGVHLLIERGPELGRAIVRLLDEPSLGLQLAEHARELAREVYDWRAVGQAATSAIAEVIEAARITPGNA